MSCPNCKDHNGPDCVCYFIPCCPVSKPCVYCERDALKASNEKLRKVIDCAIVLVTHPQIFTITVKSRSASARLKILEDALVAAGITESSDAPAGRSETKLIELTKGLYATVSYEDFERISALTWYAGHCGNKTYAKCDGGSKSNRNRYYMHRYILGITDKKIKVDHIDGDTLNNTRSNLRAATQAENIRHRGGATAGNTTGFRGVTLSNSHKRYVARITFNYKGKYLGTFDTAEEAAKAFDKAAREVFGSFCAKLNYE